MHRSCYTSVTAGSFVMFGERKEKTRENSINPMKKNYNRQNRQNRPLHQQIHHVRSMFRMSAYAATQKKSQCGNSEEFHQLFQQRRDYRKRFPITAHYNSRIEQKILNRNEFDLHGFTEKQAIEWVDCNINVILETLREYPAFLIITGRGNNSIGEPVLISAVEEHFLNHYAALHNLSVT
jgi:DNA-nicking Smr family endonuclease